MEHRKFNKAKIKSKQRFASFIFSRTFWFIIMIVFQVGFLAFFAAYTSEFKYLEYIIDILKVLLVISILNNKSDPTMKLVWTIFITVVPAFGVMMYLYHKLQPGSIKLKKKLKNIEDYTKGYLEADREIEKELRSENEGCANLSKYIYRNSGIPVYKNTDAVYLPNGEEYYKAVVDAINGAKKFIFIEYFIIEEGKVWNSILRLLEKKIQQNVEVRVMYDGLCSLTKLEAGYYKKLREKGIKAKPFAPARPFFTTRQNNRDHRKTLVVDGEYAFTGGINLADEYMNIVTKFGHWKDSGIVLRGDAAKGFTYMFLQMWNVSERSVESFTKYVDNEFEKNPMSNGFFQPYCDDPLDEERVSEHVYLDMINNANKYIHIMSPYLVIDNVMMSALTYAAKRGVDVKIILPGIPDKAYAYCLARTYYEELIHAGVKIYEYTPGFNHAKLMVCDGIRATVGSVNFDYRSLFLHFENGCYIYDHKCISDIEEDVHDVLRKCRNVDLEMCKNRPILYKLAGSFLRLIAPLM